MRRTVRRERLYKAGGYRPERIGGSSGCDFHCDIQAMVGIADQSVGSVVSPVGAGARRQSAARRQEIARILRPGGLAIFSVPFFWGYHGKSGRISNPIYDRNSHSGCGFRHSGYGDFWRITHEGLGLIFARAGFSRVDVFPIDGPLLALLTVRGVYHRIVPFRWFTAVARPGPARSWQADLDALRACREMTSEKPRSGSASPTHVFDGSERVMRILHVITTINRGRGREPCGRPGGRSS